MLEKEDLRFAVEDARCRHEAVVNLVIANDTKAISLLSLYVTLALATASGGIAGFAHQVQIPAALVPALFSATAVLAVGALFCFHAIKSDSINMPGRGAEFWKWADGESVTAEAAYREYLQNLSTQHAKNNAINAAAARDLRRARACGLTAPIVATLIGVLCPYVVF